MPSLGTLTYDLVAKIGGFVDGMTQAERQAQKSADAINKQIEGIGVASYAAGNAIGQYLKEGIDTAIGAFPKLIDSVAQFQDIADKTGGSAAGFAAFAVSAQTADVSIESIAAASAKLSKSLLDAGDAAKPINAGLSALGINIKDFTALSPDQQIKALANSFGGFADGANKAAVAQQILGKSGADLLKFFKDYTDNGGDVNILTGQMITQADDFTDAQKRLRGEIEQFLGAASTYFIEPMTILKQLLVDTAKEALGADGTFTQLGANQAVQNFAENVGRSLAGAIDYVRQSVTEFQALTDFVTQSAKALGEVASGNFAQAAQTGADFRSKYGLDDLGRKVSAGTADAGKQGAKSFTQAFEDTLAANRADRNRAALNAVNYGTGGDNRPQLHATAPPKAGRKDNSAAQEAKAQLASDLDDIKNTQKAAQDSYANSQKVLEAMHSAGLTSDQDYYAQRKQLLDEDTQAQTSALNATIARLQQENLSGKDAIDNNKKIADAQSQLVKVQKDAAASATVLGIQEQSAYAKIAASLLAARQAAQDYFDTVNKGYARDVASVGQGDKTAAFNQQLSGIEDNYQKQRQDLANRRSQAELQAGGTLTAGAAKQYDDQLAIINEFQGKATASFKAYYSDLNAAQADWTNGAIKSLQNYADAAANTADLTKGVFDNAFKGLEDQLTTFFTTGKANWKDYANSVIADVTRMFVKQQITGPLAAYLGGSSSSGGTGIFGSIAALIGGGTTGGGNVGAGLTSMGHGGFASGGFTGVGAPNQPAGIVHKGEYVLNASQTAKIGVNNLDKGNFGGGTVYSPTFVLSEPTSRATQEQIVRKARQGFASMGRI